MIWGAAVKVRLYSITPKSRGAGEGWSALRARMAAWLKVDSGFDYAANFSSFACIAYTSSCRGSLAKGRAIGMRIGYSIGKARWVIWSEEWVQRTASHLSSF
jgi:hypothetical protein